MIPRFRFERLEMSQAVMTRPSPPPATPARRLTPLARLARFSVRRRGLVLVGWGAALALAAGLTAAFGAEFAADYSVPGSDSQRAQELLDQRFPDRAGDTVDVVVQADSGVQDPAVVSDVKALLADLAKQPHVASVEDPYANPTAIAPDGRTLVAQLRYDVTNFVDVPVEDTEAMIALAEESERDGLQVALGGQAIAGGRAGRDRLGDDRRPGRSTDPARHLRVGRGCRPADRGCRRRPGREWRCDRCDRGAGRRAGVGHIGGDDDRTRYRHRLRAADGDALPGVAGRRARARARDRRHDRHGGPVGDRRRWHGRRQHARAVRDGAVVHAWCRRPDDPRSRRRDGRVGHAVPRPPRILRTARGPLADPPGRRSTTPAVQVEGGHVEPGRAWVRWSHLVNRHSVVASIVGVGLLLAIAAPFLGLRFGFADAGNNREETTTRQAYDLKADAFGRRQRPSGRCGRPRGRQRGRGGRAGGGHRRHRRRCRRLTSQLNAAADTALSRRPADDRTAGRADQGPGADASR